MAKTIKACGTQGVFQTREGFVTEQDRGAAVAVAAVQNGKEVDPLAVRTILLADLIQDQEVHGGEGLNDGTLTRAFFLLPGLADPVDQFPDGRLEDRPSLRQKFPRNGRCQVVFAGARRTEQNQATAIEVLGKIQGKALADVDYGLLGGKKDPVVVPIAVLVAQRDRRTVQQGRKVPLLPTARELGR